jgi:hypothetical protein
VTTFGAEATHAASAWPSEQYTAEERVLLACARVDLSEADQAGLTGLLEQNLDWISVCQAAQWQGLSGLLYYHLRGPRHQAMVPAGVASHLKQVYLTNTARHLRGQAELVRVLHLLDGEGIPVVLLKGAALVGTVYREPGMRAMGDVDVLVPRARANEAQAALQRQGYVPAEEGRDEHWAQHQHLPRLLAAGAADGLAIEVHGHVVRVDGPLSFDIEEFWQRARPSQQMGAPALVLAPEDLVLHLSLNFFRDRRFHSRGALRQLCDLATVVGQYEVDWGALAERSRGYDVAGPVACTLRLARLLLNARVPRWIVPALAPRMSDRDAEAFARSRVVTTRRWVATELVKPQEVYGNMTLMRNVLRRIVPTREYMRLHYGTAGFDNYWRRLAQSAQVFGHFVQRPSELTDDLTIDRWVHSLYGKKRKRAPDAS